MIRTGNRNFNESLTTTLPKGCIDDNTPVVCEADKKMLNPDLNASDNRMAAGQGWSYDAAGNVIGDPQGRSFIYDAENKQVEVENSLEQSIGKYWFDGDGKRIKKDGIAPNGQPELTVFVYDAGGKLIGEYSTNVETAAPQVQYLTADHLGSPRINTDQNGAVTSRTDYMPYGEEIIALGGRSANESYSPDDIRKGFTGYENDSETDLDFAQARMYNRNQGRFTVVDMAISSGSPNSPQSWNRYAYVLNTPLFLTDSTGLDWGMVGGRPVWFQSAEEREKAGAAKADTFYQNENDEWIELNENGPTGNNKDEAFTYQGWRVVDESAVPEEYRSKSSPGTTEAHPAGFANVYGGVTSPHTAGFGPVVGFQSDMRGRTQPQVGIIWSSLPDPVFNASYNPGEITPGLNLSFGISRGYANSRVNLRGRGGSVGTGIPLDPSLEVGVSSPGIFFMVTWVGPPPGDFRYMHENSKISPETVKRIRRERGLPDPIQCSNNDSRSCQ